MNFKQRGQTLVELLVVIGIMAIMLPALATAMVASREGRVQESARLQAASFLNESQSAVQVVRDAGWQQFAVNGTYHPVVSGTTWGLSANAEVVDGFTRSVQISDAQRDTNGAIVEAGGTVDPSTKKVTYTVSWNTPIASTLSSTAYFQRYEGNASWTQTTEVEFNTGTKSSTTVDATGGGQVSLSTGGSSINFVQSAVATPEDNFDYLLSKSFSTNVTAGNAIIVAFSWDPANGPIASCSDDRSNTYGTAVMIEDTTMQQSIGICYALNVTGGATTISANFSTPAGFRRMVITEYSGVASTDALDVVASATGAASTATDAVSSTAATTTMANELVFGAVMDTEGQTTINPGTGFTQRNYSNNKDLAVQDKNQATAASVSSTQTFGTTHRYAAAMAVFRPSYTSTANWTPLTQVSTYDVPSSITDATRVFVDQDRAYLVYGSTLRTFSVTNPSSPISLGTYTAPGIINDVFVKDKYAYLATTANSAELIMVRLTDPVFPVAVASVDLAGTHDGRSVFVADNKAYVARVENATAGQDEFFIVNVPTPDSPSVAGSVNLTGNTNDLFVSGNFAYLATANLVGDLTAINVTNSASPTVAGMYDAAGSGAGRGVFAIGTTVYFVKDQASGGPEFYIFNATNPASISVVGSYEAGATLQSVFVSGNRAFIAGAIASAHLRVLNISTPSSPTVYSSLNMNATINDVFVNGNYAYMASTSDTAELAIARGVISRTPTGGGGGYQSAGTFESASFDAGSTVAFNNIIFTINEPASTDVRFQVATNTNNSTWNFVGPDGTSGTYYSANSPILFGTSGRYIRYKATLTGPGSSTPTISDVSINYSP
ncbi:MAG TPA: prepilin-type N-terminal cleavage/methylation domain-containing protein [Candidatus Saccharimonadales bacterium]|nr:prepilin-type N-terminal cleavage/methylation domain-containing protein [Candidatus Saccharimonadales bacterium]